MVPGVPRGHRDQDQLKRKPTTLFYGHHFWQSEGRGLLDSKSLLMGIVIGLVIGILLGIVLEADLLLI